MGLPDEAKDFPGTLESSLGGGKDLLYGWLVGRAAAELGLAQALATSEAQRSEQIKQLEESLLGQIRELRESESSNDAKGSAELDALEVELQRVIESQRQSAADRAHVEQLEAAIRGKLGEFESQIQRQSQSGASSDLGDIKFELKLCADRIARTEYSVQQAEAHAASQSQRVEELSARIDIVQNQLGDNIAMLESRDAEIAALKSQVQNLSQSANLKSATPAATENRLHAPIGVTFGLSGVKAQTETMKPSVKSAAEEPNSLLDSYDAVADGSEDQRKQLRRRMSADIERVRAELRKRAGVSR